MKIFAPMWPSRSNRTYPLPTGYQEAAGGKDVNFRMYLFLGNAGRAAFSGRVCILYYSHD